MHEELTGDGEHFIETAHEKVRRVITDGEVGIDLPALRSWLDQPSPADVRAELKRWVIDFNPPGGPAVERMSLIAVQA
jgi:cell division FtsZ-interacting protein ZapD